MQAKSSDFKVASIIYLMLIRLTPQPPIYGVWFMAKPAFPKTLLQFQEQFSNDTTCRQYLADSRWPDGYRCPRCRKEHALVLPGRNLWRCRGCGYDVSVTVGTVLHRTHTSLRHWFWAAFLVTTHTPGLSARQLKRQLGIRYETAWAMLQKLRRAMIRPDRERLRGEIEVDETYVGGPETGLRGGRELQDKTLVVGAVEIRGRASGRIRLRVVLDASGSSLTGFVRENVEPGTVVITDGWKGYLPLAGMGYRHYPHPQADRVDKMLPRIHRAFGNLKTWLRGTHHGVSRKHLQVYLDEFTFRFNRRSKPMAAFQTLLGLGSAHPPTTYKMLYAVESTG
jgi:transposase-like protein